MFAIIIVGMLVGIPAGGNMQKQDKSFLGGSPEFPLRTPGWTIVADCVGSAEYKAGKRRAFGEVLRVQGGFFATPLQVLGNRQQLSSMQIPEVLLDDPAVPAIVTIGVSYSSTGKVEAELPFVVAPWSFQRNVHETVLSATGASVFWNTARQRYELYAGPGDTFELRYSNMEYQVIAVSYWTQLAKGEETRPNLSPYTMPAEADIIPTPFITLEVGADWGDGTWTKRVPIQIDIIPRRLIRVQSEGSPAVGEAVQLIETALGKLRK